MDSREVKLRIIEALAKDCTLREITSDDMLEAAKRLAIFCEQGYNNNSEKSEAAKKPARRRTVSLKK